MTTKNKKTPNVHRVSLMGTASMLDIIIQEQIAVARKHLYSNHIEQAKLQLSREPRPLPRMKLDPSVSDLFAFRYEHFTLEGYDPHPAIYAPVAI